MFSFVSIKLLGIFSSSIRPTDELIASMAIGSSRCFQEGIKFLSDEQQFVLDIPRRLFAYVHATLGVPQSTSNNNGHSLRPITMASGPG